MSRTTDLPEPMTPPDCDLRGYDFVPLFGHRLFGSSFYARALRNPRGGLAAIRLWWAAWQQCPAGSLPSSDDDLCHLADFGTDVRSWLKVKAVALHGFVMCSDGRLYHPFLCEEAQLAFERRRKERDRKARLRAAKTQDDGGKTDSVPQDVPRDSHGTGRGMSAGQDADVPADRTGQGQDRTYKKSEASPLPVEPAPASPPSLWVTGLTTLRQITGRPEAACRQLIGKWRKALGDDDALLLGLLIEAQTLGIADPTPWIEKAVAHRAGRAKPAPRQSNLSWMADELRAEASRDNAMPTIDGEVVH